MPSDVVAPAPAAIVADVLDADHKDNRICTTDVPDADHKDNRICTSTVGAGAPSVLGSAGPSADSIIIPAQTKNMSEERGASCSSASHDHDPEDHRGWHRTFLQPADLSFADEWVADFRRKCSEAPKLRAGQRPGLRAMRSAPTQIGGVRGGAQVGTAGTDTTDGGGNGAHQHQGLTFAKKEVLRQMAQEDKAASVKVVGETTAAGILLVKFRGKQGAATDSAGSSTDPSPSVPRLDHGDTVILAYKGICPHASMPLYDAELLDIEDVPVPARKDRGLNLRCRHHNRIFDLSDGGKCVNDSSVSSLKMYVTRLRAEDGEIEVYIPDKNEEAVARAGSSEEKILGVHEAGRAPGGEEALASDDAAGGSNSSSSASGPPPRASTSPDAPPPGGCEEASDAAVPAPSKPKKKNKLLQRYYSES